MMTSTGKSLAGCWTCKVRRKKCDQSLPVCTDCVTLEIQCYYSKDKPIWMDGGDQQHEMAEQLKNEIKRNAKRRRGQSRIRSIARELNDGPDAATQSDSDPSSQLQNLDGDVPIIQSLSACADDSFLPVLTPPDSVNLTHSLSQDTISQSVSDGYYAHVERTQAAAQTSVPSQSDFEPGLLMSYLDYAFPVLFPFYRPSVLEGGRTWLLTLVLKHSAFYHNIVGLAAYFYFAISVAPGPEQDACAAKAHMELQTQMEKAVRGVQNSLRDVTWRGVENALSDSICLLGNIVQLVNFEVVFASSGNWQIHQDAAVGLFDQIIRQHGSSHEEHSMAGVLRKLCYNAPMNCSYWSAEQAAFRFFGTLILYQDIIASTSLEQEPKLMQHCRDLRKERKLLQSEDLVGCQTWVLLLIADISILNEWKKESKQSGNFDVLELVDRASPIRQHLHDGMNELDGTFARSPVQPNFSPYKPLEVILSQSNIYYGSVTPQAADQRLISSIWAYAAQTYLIIILSGWQPANTELRCAVARALELLNTITSPSWLRSLAWPFCITGCLATQEQESSFRNIAHRSGALVMFGTVRNALEIMEAVWSKRCQHNADTWDIASCLRILGHSVLLV